MSAEITRDQRFPAACRHCGGVLQQHVDCCPYCGANHPLERAALRVRSKGTSIAPGAAPPASGSVVATERPTVKPDFQQRMPIEHEASPRQTARRSFPKVIWIAVLVFGLVYAAYLLLGANPKQESTPDDSGMHSSGGSISSTSPAQQTNTTPQSTGTPPQASAPASQLGAQRAAQIADVPESLRAARASLAAHDLSDAKTADAAALTRDPNNNDARDIQRDIAAREQQRDSALQNADRCAGQHDWACMQQQASQALAIDSSSQQAQSVMEHAILASAWTPASAAPGAAPANAPASNQVTPNPAATAGTSGASGSPGGASNDNSAEARERAIVQYGWKQAAPSNATH